MKFIQVLLLIILFYNVFNEYDDGKNFSHYSELAEEPKTIGY